MGNLIFEGNASIEVQGDLALQLLSIEPDHASFELIGFSSPWIIFKDYRQKGLVAVDYMLKTGWVDQFASQFNHSAYITISVESNNLIQVNFYDTNVNDANFVLWAAIGISNNVPVYPYIFYEIAELTNGLNAFFALYDRSADVEQYFDVDQEPVLVCT